MYLKYSFLHSFGDRKINIPIKNFKFDGVVASTAFHMNMPTRSKRKLTIHGR